MLAPESSVPQRSDAVASLSEAQVRRVLNQGADIVWVTSPAGRVTEDSPSWRAFTGQTFLEYEGLGWLDAIHPDDQEATFETWRSAVCAGRGYEAEYRLRHVSGGWRWTTSRAYPLSAEGGGPGAWIGFTNDSSARREAAEARKTERERFVSGLVHDLRSAFGTGRVAMDMLLAGELLDGGDPEERRLLETIVMRSFARVDRLADDLLDAGQIQAGGAFIRGAIAPFDLARRLREVAEPIARVHDVALVFDLPPSLEVRWCADDVERVIENLVSNAMKYGDRERAVTITGHHRGTWVRWSVHNWGDALPGGDGVDLFAFQTRAEVARRGSQRGWGIGLTVVRGIIEAHGGRVVVTSEVAHGTRFAVEMPIDAAIDRIDP